jgi:hypothetical protein
MLSVKQADERRLQILTLDELETASHRGSNLIPVRHALGFRPVPAEYAQRDEDFASIRDDPRFPRHQ